MHDDCSNAGRGRAFGRRRLFATSGAAVAAGALGAGGAVTPALGMTREERDRLSPDQIIQMMKDGNARFRAGQHKARDFLREQRTTASGQFPAAVILSCIDSRVPAEIVMDLGIGDIFNARTAGNVADVDILGSLEFACAAAGSKVVLVLGHTACGAVKGAIDGVQLGNLTQLLYKIRPAVEATVTDGERSSKNDAFVHEVCIQNVVQTIKTIRDRSPVLVDYEAKGQIKIVGALYHLDTGAVSFLS